MKIKSEFQAFLFCKSSLMTENDSACLQIKEVVIGEGEKTSYKTGKIWKSMHEAPILIMQHCSTTPYLATGSADNTVKVS